MFFILTSFARWFNSDGRGPGIWRVEIYNHGRAGLQAGVVCTTLAATNSDGVTTVQISRQADIEN
jgi:hypothetical protein